MVKDGFYRLNYTYICYTLLQYKLSRIILSRFPCNQRGVWHFYHIMLTNSWSRSRSTLLCNNWNCPAACIFRMHIKYIIYIHIMRGKIDCSCTCGFSRAPYTPLRLMNSIARERVHWRDQWEQPRMTLMNREFDKTNWMGCVGLKNAIRLHTWPELIRTRSSATEKIINRRDIESLVTDT